MFPSVNLPLVYSMCTTQFHTCKIHLWSNCIIKSDNGEKALKVIIDTLSLIMKIISINGNLKKEFKKWNC